MRFFSRPLTVQSDCFLTFSHIHTFLTPLQQTGFEIILAKGEMVPNKQFHLLSHCFQLFLILLFIEIFHNVLSRCYQSHLLQDFCIWERVINWLINWLGFNAFFNNFSVISRRPVHIFMHFLVFSHKYSTQQSSQLKVRLMVITCWYQDY